MRQLLIAIILFGNVANASAFCSEPYVRITVPDAPGTFDRPSIPYCLTSFKWSGKHDCDSWELDRYKRDVSDYIEKLEAFVNDTNDLARKAKRYADEAYDYAVCEVDEVSGQHR